MKETWTNLPRSKEKRRDSRRNSQMPACTKPRSKWFRVQRQRLRHSSCRQILTCENRMIMKKNDESGTHDLENSNTLIQLIYI